MFNSQYYEEKQRDIIEQVNKLFQKKIQADYDFVKEHSELVQKFNQIESLKKEEENKKTPEVLEQTKTTPKKK